MHVCMCIHCGDVFFLEDGDTTKAKERQGDAQPSPIPEESSISTRSDPGGWLWSRGAPSHRAGWSRGSPALCRLVGLLRRTVWLAGKRLRGRRCSVFFLFFLCITGVGLCDCPCVVTDPTTVCATLLKLFKDHLLIPSHSREP